MGLTWPKLKLGWASFDNFLKPSWIYCPCAPWSRSLVPYTFLLLYGCSSSRTAYWISTIFFSYFLGLSCKLLLSFFKRMICDLSYCFIIFSFISCKSLLFFSRIEYSGSCYVKNADSIFWICGFSMHFVSISLTCVVGQQ